MAVDVKTIYIVDDDEAIRDSLGWRFKELGYYVECYPSAEDFFALPELAPLACLILDVRMRGLSGLQLQEKLMEAKRKCSYSIIFISGHGDIPMTVRAMKNGAIDFLEKPFEDSRLLSLVEVAFAKAQLEQDKLCIKDQLDALRMRLTKRERSVMQLVVMGRLNKQIAAELRIGIKTVEAHRANIKNKLNAKNRAEFIKMAMMLHQDY
ncbi:MAG: response regulator [Gammaproteobacteria bacterium]|nr:response regulator [Gammaproteobacteria bacterium]